MYLQGVKTAINNDMSRYVNYREITQKETDFITKLEILFNYNATLI